MPELDKDTHADGRPMSKFICENGDLTKVAGRATHPKRLIEVAFPLEEVSAHSRAEKNIRHGHISTLHIWWARRPLAACRAFIYASLVNDPGDPIRRDELIKEVADLASWKAVREPDAVVRASSAGGSGLTGRELLARARQRILDDNDGEPPSLLDPFAGGGAIPLEGLRLGCRVEASDLNPVAVLILKGTVEYPQRYGRPLVEQNAAYELGERASRAGVSGQVPAYITPEEAPLFGATNGTRQPAKRTTRERANDLSPARYRENPLAADVRYWGGWMLEQARAELARFYPPDPDGSQPVAYLWSRTIPCPSCGGEMPLMRQYWLAKKDKKKVALEPVVDQAAKRVTFRVVEGSNVTGDPAEATTSRGDTKCLLCGQVAKAQLIQEAGQHGRLGAVLTAVVLDANGGGGKRYRAATESDIEAYESTRAMLSRLSNVDGMSTIPDEPLAKDPRNIWCYKYGLDTFGKLFSDRQLLALTTFARLVRQAHAAMLEAGLDPNYAKAVATYLGLAVDRLADYNATVSRWGNDDEGITNTFARQAIPMVWDFGEANPIGLAGGSWSSLLSGQIKAIRTAGPANDVTVVQCDARASRPSDFALVLTDPPYYDAISYAELSDFFYVWLKRSLGFLYPDYLSLPLTPKKEQLVANAYAQNGNSNPRENRKSVARRHYVDGMAQTFSAISGSLKADGLTGVVFAHTDPDAWANLIEGLLNAGLIPDSSWPLDTEQSNKVSSLGQARLKTSVWMACRRRGAVPGAAFLPEVTEAMRPVIRERLLAFWAAGIRGADFFIAAIGPALSVFGRHTSVQRLDGEPVSIREFLDIVRREATQVALEQVLGGADLGVVDGVTRQYVTWVWGYGRAPLDAGEALALCLATGADYGQVVRPGSIAQEVKETSKKLVRLRTIGERALKDEQFGQDSLARPAALVEQLQYAAWLWSQNRAAELGAYRGELGEARWAALRPLGQAVAECLPEGDKDRQMILGLLGSGVAAPNGRPVREPKPVTLAMDLGE